MANTKKNNYSKAQIMQMVIDEANRQGVDPSLALALVQQESGFNPNAKSSAGAMGLMQLMPATAKSLGVTDAYEPSQAIKGGITYLKNALIHYNGNVQKALASYNAGFGAVDKYGGIPPYAETQNYVKSILALQPRFSSSVNSPDAAVVSQSSTPSRGGITGAAAPALGTAQTVTAQDLRNYQESVRGANTSLAEAQKRISEGYQEPINQSMLRSSQAVTSPYTDRNIPAYDINGQPILDPSGSQVLLTAQENAELEKAKYRATAAPRMQMATNAFNINNPETQQKLATMRDQLIGAYQQAEQDKINAIKNVYAGLTPEQIVDAYNSDIYNQGMNATWGGNTPTNMLQREINLNSLLRLGMPVDQALALAQGAGSSAAAAQKAFEKQMELIKQGVSTGGTLMGQLSGDEVTAMKNIGTGVTDYGTRAVSSANNLNTTLATLYNNQAKLEADFEKAQATNDINAANAILGQLNDNAKMINAMTMQNTQNTQSNINSERSAQTGITRQEMSDTAAMDRLLRKNYADTQRDIQNFVPQKNQATINYQNAMANLYGSQGLGVPGQQQQTPIQLPQSYLQTGAPVVNPQQQVQAPTQQNYPKFQQY